MDGAVGASSPGPNPEESGLGPRTGEHAAQEEREAARSQRRRLREILRRDYRWKLRWERQRRWIVRTAVVLGLLSVPLLGLSLIGLPHVFRAPVVREVVSDVPDPGVVTPQSPDFPAAVEMLTGARLQDGNRVEILTDGEGTFPPLWRDLRAATRSITVQMYYAKPGAVMDTVARILAERARAGVAVYFLYDAFGAQSLPSTTLADMGAAGVQVRAFRPLRWYAPDRANHRLHDRGIVIDGRVGYTGGFGFDDKWLGGGRQPGEWRETNARIEGPAVAQLQSGFVARWAEATGHLLLDPRLLPSESRPAPGGQWAAVMQNPSVTGTSTGERLLALSLRTAQQRLWVSNAYFVPGNDFLRLLEDAARRGVDVRILTNGRRSDVQITWRAGRSTYERLLRAGVRVYEYQPSTLHAKTLVADGVWSAVTTMNFDNRSLAYNSESALLTLDRGIGATLDSLFLSDLGSSREIRLESFRRRPWTQRVLERSARLLSGVL